MDKYKIVGIIDLFFGIPQIILSIIVPLSAFPKLSQMYSDFNLGSQLNLTSGYIVILLILAMGLINLFLGIKGLAKTKEGKYFKYGIISAIASFLLTGILIGILNFSILFPIYSLTPQL